MFVQATALHMFEYDVTQNVVDQDGDRLTFSVGECGCTPWLSFNGTRVSGIPPRPGFFQVFISITDARGGLASGIVDVTIVPNSAPVVARTIGPMLTAAGTQINFDAAQGGSTFAEPDGDALSYEVKVLSPPLGLDVVGARVIGSLAAVGAVNFKIVAHDPHGESSEHAFSFAVAGPEPGVPVLPAVPYTYDDAELDWPRNFAKSRAEITPFWDTTPPDNPTSDAGATLGRVLFYDKRLSITNTHSCSSCHRQDRGFAGPEQFPAGIVAVPLQRNAMALTNVRYNFANKFFADERVETLERLALLPIEEPNELGNSLPLLQQKLAATSFYPSLFQAAFGSPEVTSERIAKSLAQFMRALVSYQTKFDAAHFEYAPGYYTDPATVFTPLELRGAEVFDDGPLHCDSCHSDDIQALFRPMNNGLHLVFTDLGTGDGKFRTASLRNIALTAPYMHDGRFSTLREVIDHYDHGMQFKHPNGVIEQIDHNMTEEDKDALEAFLHTLTDTVMVQDPRFSDPFQ